MTGAPTPLRVAFLGGFSACFVEPVRARLAVPCDIVLTDERDIVARMPEVDVLVSLDFTAAMGAAAARLRLVQVPGAGTDRIDRAALPPRRVSCQCLWARGRHRGVRSRRHADLEPRVRPARRESPPGALGGGLVA